MLLVKIQNLIHKWTKNVTFSPKWFLGQNMVFWHSVSNIIWMRGRPSIQLGISFLAWFAWGPLDASAGFFVLGIRFCFWDDEWWSTFGRRRLRLVLCFLLNQPSSKFVLLLQRPKVVWGWVRILPPRIIYKQVFYRWWCERSFIKFTAL